MDLEKLAQWLYVYRSYKRIGFWLKEDEKLREYYRADARRLAYFLQLDLPSEKAPEDLPLD